MKLKNFSDLTPELIVWEDIIEHSDTWASEGSIQEFLLDKADAHVEQVGFVLAEDDRWLLLVSSYAEADETYSNVIKIPKSVILSRNTLFTTDRERFLAELEENKHQAIERMNEMVRWTEKVYLEEGKSVWDFITPDSPIYNQLHKND